MQRILRELTKNYILLLGGFINDYTNFRCLLPARARPPYGAGMKAAPSGFYARFLMPREGFEPPAYRLRS
jgi:hypothetical protein